MNKVILSEKVCLECKCMYKSNHPTKKFCNSSCRLKNEINNKNKEWLLKTEEKKPDSPSLETAQKLKQSHAYMYDKAWLKKFKACRG